MRSKTNAEKCDIMSKYPQSECLSIFLFLFGRLLFWSLVESWLRIFLSCFCKMLLRWKRGQPKRCKAFSCELKKRMKNDPFQPTNIQTSFRWDSNRKKCVHRTCAITLKKYAWAAERLVREVNHAKNNSTTKHWKKDVRWTSAFV